MICPKCNQTVGTPSAEGCCPLCGFEVAPFQRQVTMLYVLGFGFFMSVLVYGLLVYILETTSKPIHPAVTGASWLPYAMLLLAVLVFGFGQRVGKRLSLATSAEAVRKLYIIKLALCESIAVMGLLLYFLTGSLQSFGVFLGLSLLALLIAGSQLPAIVARLAELSVRAGGDE